MPHFKYTFNLNTLCYNYFMAEEKYSEDYERLLVYKESISSETFSEVEAETINFFSTKYVDSIKSSYKSLLKNLSKGVRLENLENKMDYEEIENYSLELPGEDFFEDRIKSKYIPQALNSFKPEKITNKKSYCFATYLYNYFRHAVRDLATEWRKAMTAPIDDGRQRSDIDRIIQEEEEKRIREKCDRLLIQLNLLERQTAECLLAGKKQKDIVIINAKTGEPYTKGYISKLVKKIRSRMKKLLDS